MKDIKTQLAKTIRAYHLKGWSPATSTNYSFRENEEDSFFVSRSGIDKSQFEAEDFIRVDLDGKLIEESHKAESIGFIQRNIPEKKDVKPSAETLIHCVLYDMFPETKVILHSHSVYSVLMSQKHETEISFSGYEIQKGFGGQTTHDHTVRIPVFDNTQDMHEFSEWMRGRKEEFGNHCFVIRNHGTYAWGKDLFEAKRHLETLEYLLEVSWKTQSISNI